MLEKENDFEQVEKERKSLWFIPYLLSLIFALSFLITLNFFESTVSETASFLGIGTRTLLGIILIILLLYLFVREGRLRRKLAQMFRELLNTRENLKAQVERLDLVNDCMKLLTAMRDISTLRWFLRNFLSYLDAEAGFIFFVGRNSLIEEVAGGRNKFDLKGIAEELLVKVREAGRPLIVNDSRRGFSIMTSPLRLGEEEIGLVAFLRSLENPFSFSDLQLLDSLAGEVEISLYNARLFGEKQKILKGMAAALAELVEMKQVFCEGHAREVASLAKKIALKMGLSRSDVDEIELAALLHDIGMIGLDEFVLKKEWNLNEEEKKIAEKHVRIGAEILRKAGFPSRVVNWVLYHHERFDGSGYPVGLKGRDIPLGARIIAVADAFDAIKRCSYVYDGVASNEEAERYIQDNSGVEFDPQVVKVFMEVRGLDEKTGLKTLN